MRALSTLTPILALALFVSACGPAKVNLRSVAMRLDQHKPGITQSQQVYNERNAELTAILKQTSTPSAEPYPTLRQQLTAMRNAIAGMQSEAKRVDAFKPKFEAYAAGKSVISQEDEAAWAEYQGVMAEYNAIHADLRRQAGAFNAANSRYQALLKEHNIAKLSVEDLRAEIDGIAGEVVNGVNDMEKQVDSGRKAVEFAKQAGGDPVVLAGKTKTLDEMAGMLPGLRLFRGTVTGSKDRVLRDLAVSGELWTGPGMSGQNLGLVEDFRNARDQYRKNRQAWDDLNTSFEAKAAPAAE
jgi:hypothetical protein